jgi:hypothetical protein
MLQQTTTSTTNGSISNSNGTVIAYFSSTIGQDGALNFQVNTQQGFFDNNKAALKDLFEALTNANATAAAVNSAYVKETAAVSSAAV